VMEPVSVRMRRVTMGRTISFIVYAFIVIVAWENRHTIADVASQFWSDGFVVPQEQ